MMFFNCFLQLLVVSIGAAHLIPLDESVKHETHTFRWALDDHLNDTTCATANTPPRFKNGTVDHTFWELASKFVMFLHIAPIETRQANCQNNESLFVLVGNPGVIWHPQSRQCLHTIPDTNMVESRNSSDDKNEYVTNKALSVSDECERNNPDLALFKYDKNKPQRLSFLGDIDINTGKREEWCIRHWLASVIQVAPTCIFYPDHPNYVAEVFFHEVI